MAASRHNRNADGSVNATYSEKVIIMQEPDNWEESEQKETSEARFKRMVQDLQIKNGWSRGKARKFLESMAKRELRKLVKEGKKRQAKLTAEGGLVDTSDLKADLDKQLDDDLAAIGLSRNDLDPMVPADQWPDSEAVTYEPPTKDF